MTSTSELASSCLPEKRVCRRQTDCLWQRERGVIKSKKTCFFDFPIQLLAMNETLMERCSWISPESLQSQA